MLPEEFARKICDSVDLLNNQVAGMQIILASVQKSQDRLFNIVANGNGQPSLIAQTSNLNARTCEIGKAVDTLSEKIDEIESREATCRATVEERLRTRGIPELSDDNRLKRYGLWAAIGTGVAAFFFQLIKLLFEGC
ncbi:MAG: hypothetical protein ABIH03_14800 [Pseudomonadota bacterium]